MTALIFGFLLGLRHALEADHIAAMATLVSRHTSLRPGVVAGIAWGIGHTMTLFVVGTTVILSDAAIPVRVVPMLEAGVGLVLFLLGADVLRKLWLRGVHFHIHRHDDGVQHAHAHVHGSPTDPAHETARPPGWQCEAATEGHAPVPRRGLRGWFSLLSGARLKAASRKHVHAHHHQPFPLRPLLVGLVHGLAGSSALILLTVQATSTIWQAFVYMALFGLGSIIGMAVLSMVIVVPLGRSARALRWAGPALQTVVGFAGCALGLAIVWTSLAAWRAA